MRYLIILIMVVVVGGCVKVPENAPQKQQQKSTQKVKKIEKVKKSGAKLFSEARFKELEAILKKGGDGDQLFEMAQFYLKGFNVVPVDPVKGVSYLKKSKTVYAAILLGHMILTRRGVVAKPEEGKKLIDTHLSELKKLAEKDPVAMGLLGRCYHRGFGVKKDETKSFQLAMKGAKMGDPDSMILAGFHLYSGIGTTENLAAAIKLVTPLAERGDAEAQFALGYFYENEIGSVHWLKRSAKQKFTQALFLLGLKYLKGAGVNQSNQRGYDYIKEAADGGNWKAKQFLTKFKFVPQKRGFSTNQRLK